LTIQPAEELSRYRWVILAVAWMSFLTVFLVRLGVGPLAPFLKESFHISNAQVWRLVSAIGITYLPTLLVSGWVVDRIGVRRVLVFGTFITGLSTVALFFAPSYREMFIILALSGLGSGCIFPAAVKAIILWFPAKERATAMGINQTSINAGGIIGASLLPSIAIALDWRYGLLFMGLGTLVACLGCALLYRNPPQEELLGGAGDIPNSTAAKPSVTRLMASLFRSRDIWMLFLAGFFVNILEWGMMINLVLYLKEALLFGVVAAGGLLAMTEAAGALGKPASGLISDRLLGGRRKIVFILMAGTASLICLVLALIGHSLQWLLYPILFIFGVVAIGWGGLYTALAGELAGKEMVGAVAGISAFALVLGAMAGPPFFGYIVDITGSYQIAWFVMALSGTISVGFMSLVREYKKRI